jgi:hypothetical protein
VWSGAAELKRRRSPMTFGCLSPINTPNPSRGATSSGNAPGHPRCWGKTSRKPRPMKILAKVRDLGHPHDQGYSHHRLGSRSASTECSQPCVLHGLLCKRPPAYAWIKACSSAKEDIVMITCFRSWPETRCGLEAGWYAGTCLLPPSPFEQRPSPCARGPPDRCVSFIGSYLSPWCRRCSPIPDVAVEFPLRAARHD